MKRAWMVVLTAGCVPISETSTATQTSIGGFVSAVRVRNGALEVARCDIGADVVKSLTTWWTPNPTRENPLGVLDTHQFRSESLAIGTGACRGRAIALPPGIEPPEPDPPWCMPTLGQWREARDSLANEPAYNRWLGCAEQRRVISVQAGTIVDADERARLLVTMPDCARRPPAPTVHATADDVARRFTELTPACQRFAVAP